MQRDSTDPEHIQIPSQAETDGIIERATEVVGVEHVVTDLDEIEFYSTDIYDARERPLAVVRPGSRDDLVALVNIATAYRASLFPRGGGASYTDGYLPTEGHSLLVDTSRMDEILEINQEDMYVVVEAGVSWAKLDEALKPLGLRTPFYGPLSGLHATVGGSISQNSVGWGTGTFGVSAESVVGVEVVLATGEVLRTGSWGTATSTPFLRFFGPDLTGLFTGDVGALGIKTAVALRLIQRPAEFLGLSFRFPDFGSLHRAMNEVAKLGLNTMNFAIDSRLQKRKLGRISMSDAMSAALAVARSARNPLDGLLQVTRMGLAGRRFLASESFSCHYIVEGIDRATAKAFAAAVRNAVAPHGAEVANTIPNILQAMPFAPFTNVLGPRGERWVPIHCVLPFSRVRAYNRELEALYERYAQRMECHNVSIGSMFMTVSTNAFNYDSVFYWEDERNAYIDRMVPADNLAALPVYPSNPEGRELVAEMKQSIIELMHLHGGAHFQIGKVYPYLDGRDAPAERLLRDIKHLVDPDRRCNPGALGL